MNEGGNCVTTKVHLTIRQVSNIKKAMRVVEASNMYCALLIGYDMMRLEWT